MKNDTVEKILEIPEETQTIEFKRLGGDKLVTKVVQTIVAMTNTDGGIIFFGIDDPEKTELKGMDRVFGIEENPELFDEIGREVQRIAPPIGNIWHPQKILVPEIKKTIAFLSIPKSGETFHSIHNEVYIRQNKSNKKLTPQEIVKFSYAKGFEKADKELVAIDFELLKTTYFDLWKKSRSIPEDTIENILFSIGLARKDEQNKLLPTRAAVLLFTEYPTNILDTKCTVRVFQYAGTIETFNETPNLKGAPKTIDGPLIKVIKDAHEYVLLLLRNGIEIHSGFITKYQIPERAIKEAITNAVIHRDYHIKRDIEISIFEDRVEILSPGLFPYNITKTNIGYVRADGYRNDLIVKHLREFPEQPNLDRNEGVQAMRNEMRSQNLYDPIYFTYPMYEDSVKVVLLNEKRQSEWEKVKEYLVENRYINNSKAREITNVTQIHEMSRLLKRWVTQGLLLKIESEGSSPKFTRYKLYNAEDFKPKV
jgi:ATP-dependent DNA helicase RecG